MSSAGERYLCKFSGCGKSFARKEHLARHSRSHSGCSRHVCQLCLREFTRSDSLQRHLSRHGDSFKPTTGRSKHACAACHASKVKCDGSRPCSACLRKGAQCKYDLPDSDAHRADSVSLFESPTLNGDHAILDSSNGMNQPLAPSALTIDQTTLPDNEFPGIIPTPAPPPPSAAFQGKTNGLIDWSSLRIQKDQPDPMHVEPKPRVSQPNSASGDENLCPQPEGSTQKYLDAYFAYFHHRWTIIHAPTFDDKTHPPVVLSSMCMIGAWLSGAQDSRELAAAMHDRLVAHIIPRLLQASSSDKLQESLSMALCQGTLLNIIYGLYCGVERIISKVVILRNILVAVLREVGFFRPEVSYDNPKSFLPFRMTKLGERQRLAAYLFKVDSYLNIVRGQPAILTAEELHYTLPATFSLHNAAGLDIFETRYSIEPAIRSQTTLCDMVQDAALDAAAPVEGLMLAEDIQLGICALQPRIWHLLVRRTDTPDLSSAIEMDALRRNLESWKRLLIRIPTAQPDASSFSREQHLAMRYYYGTEDQSKDGWQSVVSYRQRSLVYDATMLYHVFSLHLYANIRILSQLAEDARPDNSKAPYEDVNSQAKTRRETYAREWAKAPNSRRALCHAAAALASYNSLSALVNKTIDPISHVALSAGALVVWAFCSFSSHVCEACVPRSQIHSIYAQLPEVELTRWAEIKAEPVLERERETWIEVGGGLATLIGLKLCRCSLDILVSQYYSCLPEGWNVADTIAPGIWKVPDTIMDV